MKRSRTMNLWSCMITLVLLLSGGCAEQRSIEYIRIKKGTPPEIVSENGKAKMIPAGYVKRRLRLGIPSIENLVIHDRQYIHITEKWFFEVMKWTEEFIALQVPDLNLEQNRPIAYDETVTLLASNFANISVSRRYNIKASVLIGLIVAKSEKSWGKIAADGQDRGYVVGLTEKGGIVYDIRTRQSIAFDDFPNIENIRGIMF